MASDNEAGIGFLRADGTARPELAPFIRLSRFLGEQAGRLRGRQVEEIVLLVPHSQMFFAAQPRGRGHQARRARADEPPARAGARRVASSISRRASALRGSSSRPRPAC